MTMIRTDERDTASCRRKLRRMILAFSAAGMGIAASTLPGEDILLLRCCETLMTAYIAYVYQVPLTEAVLKGVGISGWCTMVGCAITDAATVGTAGAAAPLRPCVAGGLIASMGWLTMRSFSREHKISAALLDLISVQGFCYDLQCLLKLVMGKLAPAMGTSPAAAEGRETSPAFRAVSEMLGKGGPAAADTASAAVTGGLSPWSNVPPAFQDIAARVTGSAASASAVPEVFRDIAAGTVATAATAAAVGTGVPEVFRDIAGKAAGAAENAVSAVPEVFRDIAGKAAGAAEDAVSAVPEVFRDVAEMRGPVRDQLSAAKGPISPLMQRIIDLRDIQRNLPMPYQLENGQSAVVYGCPDALADLLDYVQDDNIHDVSGCCGINSAVNVAHRLGFHHTEDEAVGLALEKGICGHGDGTSAYGQMRLIKMLAPVDTKYKRAHWLLNPFFWRSSPRFSPEDVGRAVRDGNQAMLHIFAGPLSRAAEVGANHTVAVSGAVYENAGEAAKFLGLTVIDSGTNERCRFLSAELLDKIYTRVADSGCILVTKKAG